MIRETLSAPSRLAVSSLIFLLLLCAAPSEVAADGVYGLDVSHDSGTVGWMLVAEDGPVIPPSAKVD